MFGRRKFLLTVPTHQPPKEAPLLTSPAILPEQNPGSDSSRLCKKYEESPHVKSKHKEIEPQSSITIPRALRKKAFLIGTGEQGITQSSALIKFIHSRSKKSRPESEGSQFSVLHVTFGIGLDSQVADTLRNSFDFESTLSQMHQSQPSSNMHKQHGKKNYLKYKQDPI